MSIFDIIMNTVMVANIGCMIYLWKELRRIGKEIESIKNGL